jgi:hypothetical protein
MAILDMAPKIAKLIIIDAKARIRVALVKLNP